MVELWKEPEPTKRYVVVADASSGVRTNEHDPAGCHVWCVEDHEQVARFGQMSDYHDVWNGYIGPYGLGMIAAHLAKRYSNGGVPALTAPESGPWQGPTLSALNDAGVYNILHDRKMDTPGHEYAKLGFENTEQTRPMFIGALEEALERNNAIINSPETVQCLRDCVIDPKGKIVAGSGYHDEDLILAGAALHIIKQRYPHHRKPKREAEKFLEAIKVQRPKKVPFAPARQRWR